MKTILYMGISANGNIAKKNGDVGWNSEAGWKSFYDHGKKTGNFIMGANTYRLALKDGEFPFSDALNIVMSHKKIKNTWGDQVVFTNQRPKAVLAMVKRRKYATALLIGGGILNASFAKEGLIDEVYLDIEPIIFNQGISLFAASNLEMKMKLLKTKMLAANTIQLHYRILK